MVHGHLGLAACSVCKQGETCDVACGVYIRHACLHCIVYLYATLDLYRDVLKAESLEHWASAHAHEYLVALSLKLVAVNVSVMYCVALDTCDLALQAELDTTLCIYTAQHLAHLLVHAAQNLGQHLNHGHLDTEAVEKACELHADDTATYYHKALGSLCKRQHLAVGEYGLIALYARDWRYKGLASCTDEQACRLVCLSVTTYCNAVRVSSLNEGFATYYLHVVCLHLHLYACNQLAHDLCLAVGHLLVLICDVCSGDAILLSTCGVVIHLCTVEQGLCGYASFVEAHTAKFAFLEQDNLQAFSTCILGSHITGGATANNC